MSLYLVQYKDNPYGYYDYGQCWDDPPPMFMGWGMGSYNPQLVTCPKHFGETIDSIAGFFYVPPPVDAFVMWTISSCIQWPSWGVQYWRFDAATGDLISRTDILNIFGIAYITSVEIGDLNHAYATLAHTTDCYQINWETGASESSQWHIHPYSWNPKKIFTRLLVDKQGDKLLGVSYPYLEIWQDVTRGTPHITWSMRLPTTVRDLAYESNDYGWVLTQNGQIYKIDWNTKKRIEMVSSVQAYNASDRGYWLAFDSFRKRLAVFRWMYDTAEGQAQSRIEWYETVPKPTYLLDPVPVERHKTGDYTKFVSKVVGDLGEGFSGATGAVELVAPNNHGTVLSPTVLSGVVGDFNISYKAPNEAATETLKLTVEIEDDIIVGGI